MGNLKNWQKLALRIADHFPKNKLTQDLAYKIISDRQVGYQAGATKSDIVRNMFSFKPKDEDTNKYMFVYGADTRRPETTIGQAYDWAEDIKENDYTNVKTYEGVLNPYNEYLVDSRNKGLIEEFAKIGYSPVSNINNEYVDWNTYRRKQEVPYHDDVHGYRPTFHFNNEKPVISSSDLYDFGKNYIDDFVDLYVDRSGTEIDPVFIMEAQRRALNSVGQPYLLVQKNIPIRFVDNPQGNEIWRTNNFNKELRLDEMSDREIANILHTGYIEPSVITAYKKGGRIHIKKKNRGKFTEYCGGKVTEECIAKGKKSKDPKIRKRATFAANARKWKHESGGILKAQEGINELYPAGIAISSNETIDFFKDFAQRYKKFNGINKNQLISSLISKDKAIVLKRGLPTYNTENKQIFIPSDDVGVSTYSHELVHKLNDLVLERTNKERKLLNDAYPLSIAKHVYGRAPEDMRNELIEDERFSTNTELRRKISSDYGNILGKKLNKVIKSLSTNDIINYVNNINGYVGESDFLKYPEHIIDGKTLFEHWKEDIGDVPEYYNMPWEELPKSKQDQWQYLYDSREGVAPNYMIFDEDKPKVIKKALIKVAQESKSNDIRSKNFINVSKQGGILKAQGGTGNGFWSKLWNAVKEGGMAARDAKLGAVGAQQVRDLYSEGKNQEAQDLAKQYAKANTTGIALAGGAASTGLLGDLMVTGATTAADTFVDGDVDNFGKNLSLNAAFDLAGHGAGKLLKNVDWGKVRNSVESVPDTKADVSEYINTVDDTLPERQPLTMQKSPQFLSYDELDDMYFRAINNGDSESIRQIRDIIWKRKAPNSKLIKSGTPIHLLHGTTNGLWTKIDPAKYSDDGISFFLTNEPEVAWTYKGVDFEPITELPMDIERGWMLDSGEWSRKIEDFKADGYDVSEQQIKDFYDGKEVVIKRDPSTVRQKNKIFDFYVNSENPLVIHNEHTKNWNNLDFEGMKTTRDISKYAKDHGYTSVTIENIYDHGPFTKTLGSLDNYANDVTIVHDPKLIKSADLITYDDSGNIIPISKRFDFNINDIRWGFTPLFLGLGAAKAISNSNTKEQQ